MPGLFSKRVRIPLTRRIGAQTQHRRFREGPFEVGVAKLRARSAVALPSRFLGTFDYTAIGDNILDPREAVDVMDFIEEHQGEDLPDPRDRAQAVEGVGIVLLGARDDGEFQVGEELIVVVIRPKSTSMLFCTAGSANRSATPRGCLVRDLLPDVGPVVLTIGMLDMGQIQHVCA